MYLLDTSSGLKKSIANPEQVTTALADELNRSGGHEAMKWTVTTPHGSIISDTIAANTDPERAEDPIDRAYALLLLDAMHRGRNGE